MSAATFDSRRLAARATGIIVVIVIVAMVEALIRLGAINQFVVPLPSQILASIPRIVAEEHVLQRFWQTLQETESGVVAKLHALATERRWEIIFLTKRPQSAGAATQLQSQRWLESKGYALPAVYVVQKSRGRIADALGLDIVIDDRPENCLDVVTDSKARRSVFICEGVSSTRT